MTVGARAHLDIEFCVVMNLVIVKTLPLCGRVVLFMICVYIIYAYESTKTQHHRLQHGSDNRRYLTRTGYQKMKRYFSRKYNNDISINKQKSSKRKYFSNTWAVHVDPPKKKVADRIAKKHGFINIGKVYYLITSEL